MFSKLIAKWRVRHNGRIFSPGDVIEPITPEEARALIGIGAAEWSPVLPHDHEPTEAHVESETASSSGIDQSEEPIDWEEESKKYHLHFGQYDIPGVGIVKGKQAAIEALKKLKENP
jgi:hypothetical protein